MSSLKPGIVITISIVIFLLLICKGGSEAFPFNLESAGNNSLQVETNTLPENSSNLFIPRTATPKPEPTSSVKHADSLYAPDNWYTPRKVSVGYGNTTDGRIRPHQIYYEQGLTLNTTPVGRVLTVLNGPFIIDFVIHNKVNNPNLEWAKLEIRDPWGNLVADGGYNRHYPSAINQQILIYKTGTFYLKIDGNLVTLDLSLQTTDPIPSVAPTPTPAVEE